MRSLSSPDFLYLWERGFGLHPLDQGLLVLGTGFPETPYESLADWPLGRRNTALVALRCACFGPRLRSWIACPDCGEKLEFEMDGRSFLDGADAGTNEPGGNGAIVVNGRSYRLPTSRDLARAAMEGDAVKAAVRLLEGCRVDGGEAATWADEDVEEVGRHMALADPMAEILIELRCPLCGIESSETLDVGSFFWTEIEARAKRILLEVHTLASRYGWTEEDVLSLSEHRRAIYLEMVHG